MNNFLLRHRKKQRFIKPRTIVVLLLVVVGTSVHIFFPNITTNVAHTLATPLWSLQNYVSEKTIRTSGLFVSKQQLIAKNNVLKQQLQTLQLETRTMYLLEEENRVLKELLDRSVGESPLVAAVLTRPNVSLYDTVVIDVGSYEGLVGGEQVAVSGDIVIGIIENVFLHTSLVKLFSTPLTKTNIMIGLQQIETVAIGQGGGNFVAQLPREVDVEAGDKVIMPGINTKLFGVIEKVIRDPTQPFQRVLFKNPVNMTELRFVNVLRIRTIQSDIIYNE